MISHLRPALVLLVLFTGLTGILYPLAITGIAQVLLPAQANGSRIVSDGKISGSALIGQLFTSDRYFHGRPSATQAPDPKDDSKTVDAPYNAANSSGSNLGPLSKKLIERVNGDVDALRKAGATSIPPDAVTASASGLDPDISPAFANLQVARIAASRGVPEVRVRAILQQQIQTPLLGVFGEPSVNVLQLNLALDASLKASAG